MTTEPAHGEHVNRIRLPLRAWMVISHLLVLGLPLLAFLVTGTLAHELQMQARGHLIHQGMATAHLIAEDLARGDDLTDLNTVLARIEADTRTEMRVVDRAGVVVVSPRAAELGTALSDSPIVATALSGAEGVAVRRPGGGVRVALALPVRFDGAVVGAVVEERSPRAALQALAFLHPTLTWGLLAAVLLTIGVSVGSGHILSRSLRALSRASARIAEGALDATHDLVRPGMSHVAEVSTLSSDMATMAARLRARLGYIAEFASNVSHEFKTPITTVRGTVELLRDDPDMPPAQRQRFFENALVELSRMEGLVNGLLALARAEEGSNRALVDLDALLTELEERYPELQVSPGAGPVLGDRAQLASVLANLVENALRHGGPDVQVRVVGAPGSITVQDDGPGISVANQARIFDRFFTTDRAGGGTGLGLALARAITVAHGGELSVESRPGDTRFTVHLPAVTEAGRG